jgi:hypothetical protein
MRLLSLVFALALAAVACGGGEEAAVTPSPVAETNSPAPSSSTPVASTTGSPTATLARTPIPCPTGDCSRIAMFMEGPSQAKPGEVLTYRLSYDVRAVQSTGVMITYPNYMKYISSGLVSGQGVLASEPDASKPAESNQLSWGLQAGDGILEIRLKVPEDAAAGVFPVGAFEPGTGTTQSNTVFTTIEAPP